MPSCEKCWWDSYRMWRAGDGDRVKIYQRLLKERDKTGPCTPKEQAGEYWDEEKQMDTRDIKS